ncbi:hypothetical protein EVAR_74504_1 [Eumeta japonica]|uniref:Uncharacterized protein n=1 Tax=Eumeta variegata TaxID=151549 RepID=A0A4C1TCF8_EUMVA|nr:hypothetical protein EVAR_74504_1 [Eumeta japonica]
MEILNEISDTGTNENVQLGGDTHIKKTLGLQWNIKYDTLGFNLGLREQVYRSFRNVAPTNKTTSHQCNNIRLRLTRSSLTRPDHGQTHKEWRKVVKRERRRRLRIKSAKSRKEKEEHFKSSLEYQSWLKNIEALEAFERDEIERQNLIENEKWLQAEREALTRWKQLQERIEKARLKRLEQELKIKEEWEREQERVKKTQEQLKLIEEEIKRKQDLFLEKLELFVSGAVQEPPEELLIGRETKPNMELCPFFNKTASCRFGDVCSRNHRYPGISKVLLIPNFYSHFGLDNSNSNEYDTDILLEYDDSETYKEFKEFFYDVLPEFKKFGQVIQFKVCNNYEKHLRGNTYIEYDELRCAVAAYRAMNTRWYAGKQISLQFCNIPSWKNAICGLQLSRRCPKGRACNFLHVFKNPVNEFSVYQSRRSQERGIDVDLEKGETDRLQRLGKKGDKIRPILLATSTQQKKIQILKNKQKMKPNSCITQDLPKSVLQDKRMEKTDTKMIMRKEKDLKHQAPQAKKENNKSIAEISKKIRKSMKKDHKTKRLKTLEFQIQRTGGPGHDTEKKNFQHVHPTWALTKSLRDKLAKCQRAKERSIVGTKRQDRARNIDIRMKTKLTDILLRIYQQKWRWTRHMMRDKQGKWCKAVSEWYPIDGKKPWKTVYKMGGCHQNDCWPKVEMGNSGQTTVEIVGEGLCQEAH